MIDLIQNISQADEAALEKILDATLQRYADLFPDREIFTCSVYKHKNRNEQLDQMIKFIQCLKD